MTDTLERSDILAVVGMTREAKILDGTAVMIGGGGAVGLSSRLEALLAKGCDGIVSFGLCGALDPAFKVGDIMVASAVAGTDGAYEADPDWSARLLAALPDARQVLFAGADQPVASVAEKAALRQRTGAGAVDLESCIVGRLARWFGIPFVVLRAVSDAADRALPPAAKVGLGQDGRPAIGPVLSSLGSNPWQIPALIRTALEAEDAFHALERARQALGARLGRAEAI
jgi:hopanoid-associated phosphorylase